MLKKINMQVIYVMININEKIKKKVKIKFKNLGVYDIVNEYWSIIFFLFSVMIIVFNIV